MKVKKGDEVVVIAGKDRGVKGKVIAANPETNKVLVEGVNRVKKHTAVSTTNRGAKTGGIEHIEAPIHASNVMVIDSEGNGHPRRLPLRRGERQERPRLAAFREGPVMSTSTETAAAPTPRLKARYRAEIVPALTEQFCYANPMQIPGLTKIVVNMGVGEAARDAS